MSGVFVDGHMHVYPGFDFATTFGFHVRAARRPADAASAWLLTERFDCSFFQTIQGSSSVLHAAGITATLLDPCCARLTIPESTISLLVFAGSQIVSRERIEVHALLTPTRFSDGAPLVEIIAEIRERGGIPAIPWAPGKWFFRRGALLRQLLESQRGSALLWSDSALRPRGWGMPRILRAAQSAGYPIIAGSDPLPIAGDEQRAGSYGVWYDHTLDLRSPTASMRTLLTSQTGVRSGERLTFPGLAHRLITLKRTNGRRCSPGSNC